MASRLDIGDTVPDFTLPCDGDGEIRLSDLRGKKVVLYFYPKDNTPICTRQAIAFRNAITAFADANTEIFGVSKDSVRKHDRFKEKHELPFTLLSDENGEVCKAYGTLVEKSMFGRKFMGIERSTFLIDETGTLRAAWRKVKLAGHIDQVLDAASET